MKLAKNAGEDRKPLPANGIATSREVSTISSTVLADVHLFVGALTAWVARSLPIIEGGIGRVAADPIELVMSFSPWLQEALEKIGPSRTVLNHWESRELMLVLCRVYDAIERVYSRSGRSPAFGLSLLPGFEDLLIVLALRSRAGYVSLVEHASVESRRDISITS